MCGICGIIHFDINRPIDNRLLRSIAKAMIHRGPDNEWYYNESGAGLAVQQLEKNIPDDGQQCMSNENGSVWVVVDGEVDNSTVLRAYLESRGHTIQTQSNSELIAHLYEEKGLGFPESLIGVFAIALWDNKKRQLILVRDRLGVKPLYLAQLPGTLLFASELKALMKHPEISREIDLVAFSEFLTFQHTLAPRTILESVKKLTAGHQIIYKDDLIAEHQYWDLVFPEEASKDLNETKHIEQFYEVFATAVKRSLQRSEPVGSLLSGGMDSSSIVAMTSNLGVQGLRTYSGGYLIGNSDGELSRARLVADHFGTRHTELPFTSEDYIQAMPRYVQYMDDPVADPASIIRMLLAEFAREDVAVLLGGEGGDDASGGYYWSGLQRRVERLRMFQRLPRSLRCSLPAIMSPFLPQKFLYWLNRGNIDISNMAANEHYSMVWAFEAEEKRLYCPILRDIDNHCHQITQEIYVNSGTTDPLSQVTYFHYKTWVAENLMMGADKMLMSHSVDFRPPFLDHELVELSARIPSHYKIRREKDGSYTSKSVLKQAMRNVLPEKVMNLKKSPFQIPIPEWFQIVMHDYCKEVLLSDSARSSGYYDINHVETLIGNHHNSPIENSAKQIRILLFFEMWRQLVLTRPGHED
jgi:asparagine synthase (glutamine-hydrolysing)